MTKEMNGVIKNLLSGIYKKANAVFTNPYKKININWLEARVLKNLPAEKLQTIKFLDSRLTFFNREELFHGISEIFINEIYKQTLQPNAYILDCGANIGMSVIYLKKQHPGSTIIAFEPDEFNYGLLQQNVNQFNLKKVELRKEAVWIENTQLNFSSSGNMSSHIEKDSDHPGGKTKAIRLKDLLNRPVDFLKMDIEGAEYEVMLDIGNNLRFVKNLFLEYHGNFNQNNELNEMLQLLTENNFSYYIKEAVNKHPTPFVRTPQPDYDVQLNIFAFNQNFSMTS